MLEGPQEGGRGDPSPISQRKWGIDPLPHGRAGAAEGRPPLNIPSVWTAGWRKKKGRLSGFQGWSWPPQDETQPPRPSVQKPPSLALAWVPVILAETTQPTFLRLLPPCRPPGPKLAPASVKDLGILSLPHTPRPKLWAGVAQQPGDSSNPTLGPTTPPPSSSIFYAPGERQAVASNRN